MKIKIFRKGSSETTREITIPPRGDFYNWWIGFLEGDGSFFIRSNNTLGFEISQKTTDAQVLYYIKTNLGFGQVNHNSKSGWSRFILSSKSSSYLNLINLLKIQDLRLIKRQIQYSYWIKKAEALTNTPLSSSHNLNLSSLSVVNKASFNPYSNNSSPPFSLIERQGVERREGGLLPPLEITLLPTLEDSWLSGFIDAEGCFRISYDKLADKYRLIFQITQDEVEILEKIKNLFGNKHRGSIIKDRTTYLLMLSSKGARELIIKYLLKFPLKSQKRIAFMKWEECHRLQLALTLENKEKTLSQIKALKESINKYS